MRRLFGTLTLCLALTLGVGTASADDIGPIGQIVRLEQNTTSADTYLQYHGRMYVNGSNGVLDEYRWGGTSCGTKVLTEAQFATLQAAQNNKKMLIEPRHLAGQGGAKCLVGLGLLEKKNLKLFE